ncbi:YqaH family protein [Bacillus sp. LB7]|uniref:YqaH family protein n=1 Tax=Bacillus sp. LB7 TaxID=3043238 RepID=UPI002649DC0B|nr:YqaH family protein [Bacillus sp. LB7]MDN5390174.1 YqaH family protein [Bacillus sp. LB7]
MNLNRFLKTDREKAERLIQSTQNLTSELPAAIEEQDFKNCVEIAATIILNCKDLQRMEHPEQVVRLHEIASKFASRGINVSTVRRVYQ